MRTHLLMLLAPTMAAALLAGCGPKPGEPRQKPVDPTAPRQEIRVDQRLRPTREDALKACSTLPGEERLDCVDRVRAAFVQQVA
jgi:hypothetical protein